jgi:hypothetical protein
MELWISGRFEVFPVTRTLGYECDDLGFLEGRTWIVTTAPKGPLYIRSPDPLISCSLECSSTCDIGILESDQETISVSGVNRTNTLIRDQFLAVPFLVQLPQRRWK